MMAIYERRPPQLRGAGIPDKAYLATLRRHKGWMSAREVAREHGVSWYTVAFVLRRLAEAGKVEEDVLSVVGSARTVEHTRVYRARPEQGQVRRVKTGLPAWLAPQAIAAIGQGRRVEGSAGMRRWDRLELEDVEARRRVAEGQSRGRPGGPENGAARTNSTPGSSSGSEAAPGGPESAPGAFRRSGKG